MRRHEMLDTVGLVTVFVLASIEQVTHFGYHHKHGLCLGLPVMIVAALLLLAVHWPHARPPHRELPQRRAGDGALGVGTTGAAE